MCIFKKKNYCCSNTIEVFIIHRMANTFLIAISALVFLLPNSQ